MHLQIHVLIYTCIRTNTVLTSPGHRQHNLSVFVLPQMSDEEIPKIETQFCFSSHFPAVYLLSNTRFFDENEISFFIKQDQKYQKYFHEKRLKLAITRTGENILSINLTMHVLYFAFLLELVILLKKQKAFTEFGLVHTNLSDSKLKFTLQGGGQ